MKTVDKEVRVLGLATYPVEAACSRYRLVQFIEPLARRGVRLTYRPFVDSRTFSTLYDTRRLVRNTLRLGLMLLRRCGDVLHAMRADVVFVQRDAVLFGPPIFEFLIARILRRPMILDLDDATWLPAPSPVYGRIAKMLKPSWKTNLLIRWSRVVICGNEAIASHVRQLGTEAKVLPTIVDVDMFRPRCEGEDNPVPVVGWIGSHSTYPYLEPLLPALAEVAGRHPFRLLIVGSGRERMEVNGSNLDLHDWSLDREIEDFRSLDVGLYPLADDAWSSAKSGFKAVQYMAVGVPYVVTPVGVCAQLGVKGLTHLEARTMTEWIEAVGELLASSGRRRQMGAAGRQYATEHFSIERQADAIADVLRAQAKPARNIDEAVVLGFGDEWSRMDQSAMSDDELLAAFRGYFGVFPWQKLPPNAVGFDFGAGSGRWARLVAPRVGRLHCIDASPAALEVARRTLGSMKNCEFHLATADEIPLAEGSADFGYSLGVLHHIPDTREALRECVRRLKPGAPFLLYIYYRFDNRPKWYSALWRATEPARMIVSRLPHPLRYLISQVIAVTIYWPMARVAAAAERARIPVDSFPLSYYRHLPFYAMRTDALDRFGTRLEQRFTRTEVETMMREAGLRDIAFSPTAPFWCAVGTRA